MAGKPKNLSPVAQQYDSLVARHPHAERKGVSMPYTSLNGHMFSFLTPENHMALRLSADQRQTLIENHNAQQTVQQGRVMQEFVDMLLAQLFDDSYQYTATLQPKGSRRKQGQQTIRKKSAGKRAATGKSRPRKKGQ